MVACATTDTRQMAWADTITTIDELKEIAMKEHELEKARAAPTGTHPGVVPGMDANALAISAAAGAAVAGGQFKNIPTRLRRTRQPTRTGSGRRVTMPGPTPRARKLCGSVKRSPRAESAPWSRVNASRTEIWSTKLPFYCPPRSKGTSGNE